MDMEPSPLELPRRARAALLPTLALVPEALPPGRPRGEVADALLQAMDQLATRERAPTSLELAHAAQVGHLAARRTLANLVRRGAACIVRSRWVAYRRSPVAEYARVSQDDVAAAADRQAGPAHLAAAMQAMAR